MCYCWGCYNSVLRWLRGQGLGQISAVVRVIWANGYAYRQGKRSWVSIWEHLTSNLGNYRATKMGLGEADNTTLTQLKWVNYYLAAGAFDDSITVKNLETYSRSFRCDFRHSVAGSLCAITLRTNRRADKSIKPSL